MFDASSRPTRQLGLVGFGWLLALILVLVTVSAQAEDQLPLTLEQALGLAQARSLQLVAQDRAASGALDSAVAAGQLPDPTLRASLDALPINGADRFSITRDDFTMRTIGISQEFTRSAKREARAARFQREAEVAQAGRAMVLANLRRDTAMAWLDRYYAERNHDALILQREEARLQIEAADSAYRASRGTQADVFAARSAVAVLEDRIEQGDRELASAITQLARWVGPAADRPLAERPALDRLPLDAEDLQQRFAHHPEIAVMSSKESAAQADVDLAMANKKVDWSVSLTYAQRGPAYSDYVFFSVSVPLQWDQTNRQDREVSAKLAALDQLRAEREEATRGHVAETLAMLQQWRSNLRRLERFDATLVPLAGERTRAALAAYRGSSGALTPVLEARRAELDTRVERLKLEAETARLWARLNYLIPADHGAGSSPR